MNNTQQVTVSGIADTIGTMVVLIFMVIAINKFLIPMLTGGKKGAERAKELKLTPSPKRYTYKRGKEFKTVIYTHEPEDHELMENEKGGWELLRVEEI